MKLKVDLKFIENHGLEKIMSDLSYGNISFYAEIFAKNQGAAKKIISSLS